MSGAEDGQRVEVAGVVRFAQAGATRLTLEVASGRYRFQAFPPLSPMIDPDILVGASVRLRGTAAASFNAPLRHILTVAMFIPQAADFIIDQLPGTGAFLETITPLDGIAQYRRNRTPATRIRVKGAVAYQRPGEDLFLQDATGGLQVKCGETNRFVPGEVVEAIGFPDVEGFLPVLQNATLIRTKEPRQRVSPKTVSCRELSEGRHHSELITLQGKLLDSSFRRVGQGASRPNGLGTILTLQNSDFSFTAEAPPAEGATEPASIPLGSTLEVSGICGLQVGKKGTMQALNLLIPSASDIRILQKASWWTPGRLLTGLAVLLAILVVAITWTIMILRWNAALRASVAEKVIAQRELQQAHDLLESRVQERSRQLKGEMTARKEAEVRFKATLAERTRLAQELHDTLEQSMTGIGLQLDAAGQLSEKQPGRANHHAELARSLLTQSQIELRRSIWDLRSRELEEFDLCNALRESGRQMTNGTDIQLRVLTEGKVRPLPEVVEENLLRIGQEALTNLIKHSSAKSATLTLLFGPQGVHLRIRDDGKGFDPGKAAGPREGHFWPGRNRERTRRLGGNSPSKAPPALELVCRSRFPLVANRRPKIPARRGAGTDMKPDRKIGILIADDHYIVRIGVVAVVNTQPDMEIVAEVADGAEAIELFEKHKPDLVLLDSRMPVISGIEGGRRDPQAPTPSARADAHGVRWRRRHPKGLRGWRTRVCTQERHGRTTHSRPPGRGGGRTLGSQGGGAPSLRPQLL